MLTIVTGPPCAGKTTYVSEHAQPGDIIIDFDALAQALGSPPHHYSAAQAAITRYARAAAIKIAITWHLRGARVWITECEPSPARWQQYARARAIHVPVAADPGELHRRISEGRPPAMHAVADAILARQAGASPAARPW